MVSRVILRQEDDDFNHTVEVTFDGDKDIWEYARMIRQFLAGCSFSKEVIDKILTDEED